MLINFVDATNGANHYTKPPPVVQSYWTISYPWINKYLLTYLNASTADTPSVVILYSTKWQRNTPSKRIKAWNSIKIVLQEHKPAPCHPSLIDNGLAFTATLTTKYQLSTLHFNKKLSCSKETVQLLRRSVLAKHKWKTIADITGLSSTTVA